MGEHQREENQQEKQNEKSEEIKDTGTLRLENGKKHHKIQLMTIIGEL